MYYYDVRRRNCILLLLLKITIMHYYSLWVKYSHTASENKEVYQSRVDSFVALQII